MNKTLIVLFVLLAFSTALYTTSFFSKHKTLVNYPSRRPFFNLTSTISTTCNPVNLAISPYNYSGIVRSGYLNIASKGSSALAFIFYGKQGAGQAELARIPTIIWLNGGPGSSSQLGNFMELGPFWLQTDSQSPYKIVTNNNSWVKEYNVLFIDQPVGTGLSYADPDIADPYVHSMDDVAEDFYDALHSLYNGAGCFNQLGIKPSADLFIIGESYAGKYVPSIAAKILREKNAGTGFLTGLKGIGIGDGFTHPMFILSEVAGFAYNLGLIDFQQRAKMQQLIINASFQSRGKMWRDLHDTFDNVLDSIVDMAGGVNVYDLTKYQDYADEIIGEYLSDPEVQKLYGLNPSISFGSQSEMVYAGLYEDFMKPYVDRVEACLHFGIKVLIYNGQNDIIVENPGTMKWVERIIYKDTEDFRKTLFKTWKVDGRVAGSVKSAGNLEFRIVNNAGHLVPMDQGRNALEMVKSFVQNALSANS